MLLLSLVTSSLAASPLLDLLPLGGGLYVHHAPVRGVVYSATQAIGIAGWAASTMPAYSAATNEDDRAAATWQGVLVGAATLTVGSYVISILDGGHLSDLEADARRQQMGSLDYRPNVPDVALVLPGAGPRPLNAAPLALGAVHAD